MESERSGLSVVSNGGRREAPDLKSCILCLMSKIFSLYIYHLRKSLASRFSHLIS